VKLGGSLGGSVSEKGVEEGEKEPFCWRILETKRRRWMGVKSSDDAGTKKS